MTRKNILVAVLKSPRDLSILLRKKWYRIPLAFLPTRRFSHVAFYEPKSQFGTNGGRIRYYAPVSKREVKRRVELLPDERIHPRAHDDYLKCSFRKIEKLERPIRNIIPRRVSFGFTDLKTLCSARDILELYHVAPTEQIIERALHRLGIPVTAQCRVIPAKAGIQSFPRSHYRLDLAIFCKDGNLAIECDNRKAHSGKLQGLKDRQKDRALKRLGWRVIRLTESDILDNLDSCISRTKKLIYSLGGVHGSWLLIHAVSLSVSSFSYFLIPTS